MDSGSQQSRLDARLRQYQALVEVAESIAAHRDLTSLLQDLKVRLRLFVKFGGVQVVLHAPSLSLRVLVAIDWFFSNLLEEARFSGGQQ